VLVSGCDEGPKNDRKSPAEILGIETKNNPLAKIAPRIYFMQFEAALAKLTSCEFAKIVDEVKGKDPQISAIFADKPKECEFWKSVKQATKPTFAKIVREKSVPESVYSFSVFKASGDIDQYTKVSVGVFENIDTCQRLSAQYQEFGEGTAPCKEWVPLKLPPEIRPPVRK